MRPSILPNLLRPRGATPPAASATSRCSRSARNIADDTPEGQRLVAAGLRAGAGRRATGRGKPRAVDALRRQGRRAGRARRLRRAGRESAGRRRARPAGITPAAPARCGSARRCSPHFGELHPRVLRRWTSKAPAAAFEVFLDARARRRAPRARPRRCCKPSPFQPVERDFAFVVDCACRRRSAPRGQGRRQGADHRGRAVRRLRGRRASARARSRSPSRSRCSRSDAHPDRRRDRGGRRRRSSPPSPRPPARRCGRNSPHPSTGSG